MKRILIISTRGEHSFKTRLHELKTRNAKNPDRNEQLELLEHLLEVLLYKKQLPIKEITFVADDMAVEQLDKLIAAELETAEEEACSDDAPSSIQRKILRYFKKGKTAKEVADKLYKSVHTIISHKRIMHKKYKVHKITELLKLAERRGWIAD